MINKLLMIKEYHICKKNIYNERLGFFGHPEVYNVCLVISLFADIFILYLFYQQETLLHKDSLETLCDNIIYFIFHYLLLFYSLFSSNYTPHSNPYSHYFYHLKSFNNNQLGYYLAGLIDGDGYFHKHKNYLTISYNLKDIIVAEWLKDQIGYGIIKKLNNKNYISYKISDIEGLLKVLELINGKLKTKIKYDQVNKNLLKKNEELNKKFIERNGKFKMGDMYDFDNYWLAGYIDADGSFQIKIIDRINRTLPEIRLKLQIAQIDKNLLNYIKLYICESKDISEIDNLKGCYIGKRIQKPNKKISYYLETTSFNRNKFIIEYLEKYKIISYKKENYKNYKEVYMLIMDKQHLVTNGINKIRKIKERMKNEE